MNAQQHDAPLSPDDPRYRRAARLLAQKLGVDAASLSAEQVREYARKIEIARQKGLKKD